VLLKCDFCRVGVKKKMRNKKQCVVFLKEVLSIRLKRKKQKVEADHLSCTWPREQRLHVSETTNRENGEWLSATHPVAPVGCDNGEIYSLNLLLQSGAVTKPARAAPVRLSRWHIFCLCRRSRWSRRSRSRLLL
jgi:hypothetical protein